MKKVIFSLVFITLALLRADFIDAHQWKDLSGNVGLANQINENTYGTSIFREGLSMGWGSGTYDPTTLSECVQSTSSFQRIRIYLPSGINFADIRAAAVPNASLGYAYRFIADDGSSGSSIDHTNFSFSRADLKENKTIIGTGSNTVKLLVKPEYINNKSGWLFIEYASRKSNINMKFTASISIDQSSIIDAKTSIANLENSTLTSIVEKVQLCNGSLEEVTHDLINGGTSSSNVGSTTPVTTTPVTTTPVTTTPVTTTPTVSVAQSTCIANGGVWEGVCIGGTSATNTQTIAGGDSSSTGGSFTNTNYGSTSTCSGGALPSDDQNCVESGSTSTGSTSTGSTSTGSTSTGSTSTGSTSTLQSQCIASGGTWEGFCIGGSTQEASKGNESVDLGEDESSTVNPETDIIGNNDKFLESFSVSLIKRSIDKKHLFDGIFYNYGTGATDWIYIVEGEGTIYKLDGYDTDGSFKWLKLLNINNEYIKISELGDTLKFGSFTDTLDLSMDVKMVLNILADKNIKLSGYFSRFGESSLDWMFFTPDGKLGAKLDGTENDGSIRWKIIWSN